jgi:hypothetical protein
VLLYIQIVIREVFIEISLKHMVANSVAILMNSIVVSKFLETVIREMHIVISVLKIIIIRRSPQISVPVHKNFVFARE